MTKTTNYWQETRSGIRSSTLMYVGVLVAAVSGLMQFSLSFASPLDPSVLETFVTAYWLLWITSLWILGIAFIWVGNQPFLTHFGTVVGIFHLLQGGYLLLLLFSQTEAIIPPHLFTVSRLLALLVFGILERSNLGVPLSIFIWVTSLIQVLKIALRVLGTLPEMTGLVQNWIDTAFLLLICGALIQLGRLLRGMENIWAREKYQTQSSGFADFNNPQHKWDE